MDRLKLLVKYIATRLTSVPDPDMRAHVLAEKIQQLPAAQAAEFLQAIIVGAAREKGPLCIVLDAVNVPFLASRLGNPYMSDLYTEAREQGYDELVSLLSRPEASREADHETDPQFDMPSGLRVSRAKTLKGVQLERMFADTDPRVIRAILQNPSLTEAAVLKLCTRRPASAAVQREIMNSRKWISRYAVKKALAYNPYTPTELSLKLVHFLMAQDLRIVADSFDLHPTLRIMARQQLLARGYDIEESEDEPVCE